MPSDCAVSNTVEDNDYALRQMSTALKAEITPSSDLDLAQILWRQSGARSEANLAWRQ